MPWVKGGRWFRITFGLFESIDAWIRNSEMHSLKKKKISSWVIEIDLYNNASGRRMNLELGSYGFEHLFLH